MTPVVRFEDEADAEYREAGQWYDVRQVGLGLQFFDEVDAALRQPRRLLIAAGAGGCKPVLACFTTVAEPRGLKFEHSHRMLPSDEGTCPEDYTEGHGRERPLPRFLNRRM